MRLLCKVAVHDRFLSKHSIKQNIRHVKSTLAICKHPKNMEYSMILFTAQNKSGTKYKINGNILKVNTRFLYEGRSTIQIKAPELDLQIQAQANELNNFLVLLKKAMNKTLSEKENMISSVAVTAIKASDVAPNKLIITQRSDYPAKGFARTLEILHINNIKRCTLDVGVLRLSRLRILDLSNNLIEFLPEDINKLPCLAELNLSFNQMGNSAPRKWDWMGGQLTKTLKLLNLSNNNLKFLPDQLNKLHNLVSLFVEKNELTILPSGIGNFANLRILNVGYNLLKKLPGTARKWTLDNLDISHNNFVQVPNVRETHFKTLPVCSLKEYAARAVLKSGLIYSNETLPITLIKYLELAKFCVCGKACFEIYLQQEYVLFLSAVAKNIVTTDLRWHCIPIDCYCCSKKCLLSPNVSRSRIAIVR